MSQPERVVLMSRASIKLPNTDDLSNPLSSSGLNLCLLNKSLKGEPHES